MVILLGMGAIACSLLLVALPNAFPVLNYVAIVSSVPLLTLWILAHVVPFSDGRSVRVAFALAVLAVTLLVVMNLRTLPEARLSWPCEMHSLWLLPAATLSSVLIGVLLGGITRSRAAAAMPEQSR
jgi:hypothetical protein